jgi:hypothetical protein
MKEEYYDLATKARLRKRCRGKRGGVGLVGKEAMEAKMRLQSTAGFGINIILSY